MNNMEKSLVGLAIALVMSLALNGVLVVSRQKSKVQEFVAGGNGQYGLLCVYNTSTRSLSDGQGSALSCDDQGRIILAN